MKDALELFEKWAKANHFPDWIIEYVIRLAIPGIVLLLVLSWIFKFISYLIRLKNQRIINSNLSPYYTDLDIYNSTRFYIQTKFQNVSPAEDEEPSGRYIASARQKLLPLFTKKVFDNRKNNGKYYLILADSGMGKTTFLINLFVRYKNLIRLPWTKRKLKIKLIPLGFSGCIDAINGIEDKENTVILLDSFDENVEAVDNYQKKLDEILKATYQFKIVVLTCRTQFFPNQAEEPYETGYFSFGNSGEYKFQKVYVSPFSDADVRKYLFKKFNFFNPFKIRKFFRAYAIVKKCPYLMVRPMLLNHVEDLVNVKKTYAHSYEIYKVLVEKWVQREASKPHIKKKFGSAKKYEDLLLKFSRALALDLFINREKRGGYFITTEEDFQVDGLSLLDIEEAKSKLSLFEKKTKSLLNRNTEGHYKFSHKSILEYFLAEQIVKDNLFEYNDKYGMDISSQFQKEIIADIFRNFEGQYSTVTNQSLANFSFVTEKDIDSINCVFISKFSDINPNTLKALKSLRTILIADKIQLAPLYKLYNESTKLIFHKKWDSYESSRKLKMLFKTHPLHSISKQVDAEKVPFVFKFYRSLEKSLMILEPYLAPGLPEFTSVFEASRNEIGRYNEIWEQRKLILELIKPISKNNDREQENHNYYVRLNTFLKELKAFEMDNSNYRVFY